LDATASILKSLGSLAQPVKPLVPAPSQNSTIGQPKQQSILQLSLQHSSASRDAPTKLAVPSGFNDRKPIAQENAVTASLSTTLPATSTSAVCAVVPALVDVPVTTDKAQSASAAPSISFSTTSRQEKALLPANIQAKPTSTGLIATNGLGIINHDASGSTTIVSKSAASAGEFDDVEVEDPFGAHKLAAQQLNDTLVRGLALASKYFF
jgi:hypothetical protein